MLNPRHALLLSLKLVLGQLYGRVEGYTLDELPDIILERKIELCKLVLDTLNMIAPGESRMRGKVFFYEVACPINYEEGIVKYILFKYDYKHIEHKQLLSVNRMH